jgi:hypothetical protein
MAALFAVVVVAEEKEHTDRAYVDNFKEKE